MSSSNDTRRKRLARALADRTGLSYQAARNCVDAVADAGLLPPRFDRTDWNLQAALTVCVEHLNDKMPTVPAGLDRSEVIYWALRPDATTGVLPWDAVLGGLPGYTSSDFDYELDFMVLGTRDQERQALARRLTGEVTWGRAWSELGVWVPGETAVEAIIQGWVVLGCDEDGLVPSTPLWVLDLRQGFATATVTVQVLRFDYETAGEDGRRRMSPHLIIGGADDVARMPLDQVVRAVRADANASLTALHNV